MPFSESKSFTIAALQKEELFANKIHAYTRVRPTENTRVEDLVDMALLINHGLDREKIRLSLGEVFSASADHQMVPNQLPAPPSSWKKEFESIAERRNLQLSLDQAFQIVTDFYSQLYKS
jgi:hypothetical protein